MAWVSLFAQNMLEIAVELASHNIDYEEIALKFAEHFLWIARAMNQAGPQGMWDEEDGFYYDVLRLPDGSTQRLKVRSMVGLLPLCATTVIEPWQRERVPKISKTLGERLRRMPELANSIHPTGPAHLGYAQRGIAALVKPERLRRILSRMLDESEFLGSYGVRALSRYHNEHPYVIRTQGQEYRVNYLPAESNYRHVRRELQLARSDLDASECVADPRVDVVLSLLRATLLRSSVRRVLAR